MPANKIGYRSIFHQAHPMRGEKAALIGWEGEGSWKAANPSGWRKSAKQPFRQ